jgi:hypothetical protein
MILDKNLWFAKASDPAATTTRAIPLGQADLTGDTSGLGSYQDLFLVVNAGEAGMSALTVNLQHSDTENGTFDNLLSLPTPATFAVGGHLVRTPVPFEAKNWVRVSLSNAMKIEAFLSYGVDKDVV